MSRNNRNNDTTRPRKSGAAKARRLLEHRRRLVAEGVAEETVVQMPHDKIRDLLGHPRKLAAFLKK